MKLKEKVRDGSRVKRTYDQPQTPYARVLSSAILSLEEQTELQEAYGHLDLLSAPAH